MRAIAGPKAEAIRCWILEIIDEPHARVGGACRARDWYAAFIRGLDAEAAETRHAVQADWQTLERTLLETERTTAKRSTVFGLRRGEKSNPGIDAALLQIVRWRIEDLALFGLSKLFRHILSQIASAGDQLKDVQRTLGQLSATFAAESPWQAVEQGPARDKVFDEVRVRRYRPFATDHARPGPADRRGVPIAIPRSTWRLAKLVQERQRHAIPGPPPPAGRGTSPGFRPRSREFRSHRPCSALRKTPRAGCERLNECINAARPRISACGGGQRLLAILPDNPQGDALRAAVAELNPPATVVGYSEPDVVFAFELQDLSIPHVAARLIEDRTDFAQMAARLHTRVDVVWTPLAQLAAPR